MTEDQRSTEHGKPLPEWFTNGVEAALLAPTAVNQQKFVFILHDGNKVEALTVAKPSICSLISNSDLSLT